MGSNGKASGEVTERIPQIDGKESTKSGQHGVTLTEACWPSSTQVINSHNPGEQLSHATVTGAQAVTPLTSFDMTPRHVSSSLFPPPPPSPLLAETLSVEDSPS